jgi:Pectate lyase superfamily protein
MFTCCDDEQLVRIIVPGPPGPPGQSIGKYVTTNFGAAGDGITDDTSAFAAAAAAGGWIWVPRGTYLIDPVVCSTEIHWFAEPQAVIKQRSAPAAPQNLITFDGAAASGSSWKGGIFDGSRDEFLDDYIQHQIDLGINSNAARFMFWVGLAAGNHVDDFTMTDVKFRNFVTQSVKIEKCARFRGTRIKLIDCGTGARFAECTAATLSDWDIDDIGNQGAKIYPHIFIFRRCDASLLADVNINNFHPDLSAREQSPNHITADRCTGCQIKDISVTGYAGDTTGGSKGVKFERCHNVTLEGAYIEGTDWGILCRSTSYSTIADVTMDGQLRDGGSIGIEVTDYGLVDSISDVNTNGRALKTSQDVAIIRPVITGFGNGVVNRGFGTQIVDPSIYGNTANGVKQDFADATGRIVGAKPQGASCRISGGNINYNGQAGIAVLWGNCIHDNVDLRNNGQDSSQASNFRSALRFADDPGVGDIAIRNCDLRDTQNFTKVKSASFVPGSSVVNAYGKHEFKVWMRDPQDIHYGQFLTFVNAGGAGINITAKVTSMAGDLAIVEAAAAMTFVDTACLFPMAGTWTSGSLSDDNDGDGNPDNSAAAVQNMIGVGSAANVELFGATTVKHVASNQYRNVVTVESATGFHIDVPFSPTLTAQPLSYIACDLVGVPSQQFGVHLGGSTISGTVLLQNNRYGSVSAAINNLVVNESSEQRWKFSKFAPNSEILAENGQTNGTALSTTGSLTNIIGQGSFLIPAGYQVVAVRAQVTNANIIGTDGQVHIKVKDGAADLVDFGIFPAYTIGTKINKSVPATPIATGGSLVVEITGGTDNIPTNGRVRAGLMLRGPVLSDYS